MNLTPEQVKQAVRDAGGIVHSDGNIFFTNSDRLLAAVALLRSAGDGWKQIGWTCGEGDCGRIHERPGADGSYAVPVYVPAVGQKETEG